MVGERNFSATGDTPGKPKAKIAAKSLQNSRRSLFGLEETNRSIDSSCAPWSLEN